MSAIKIQTPLDQAQLLRLFDDFLFQSEEVCDELQGEDDLFYHQVSAHLDQQDKLSKYIPSPPAQLILLLKELEQENTDFDKVREIVEKDLALMGEVIRVSNSPLYRPRAGEVNSLDKSIAFLGLDGVMQIASAVMLRRIVNIDSSRYKAFGKALWSHCVKCAVACRTVGAAEDVFTNYVLGLVHEIGRVSIYHCAIDLLKDRSEIDINDFLVIKRVMMEQGSFLSALIAGEWGMPDVYLLTLDEYAQYSKEKHADQDYLISQPGTEILKLGAASAKIHSLINADRVAETTGHSFLAELGVPEATMESVFEKLNLADESKD